MQELNYKKCLQIFKSSHKEIDGSQYVFFCEVVRSIIESLSIGVIAFNQDLEIIEANHRAKELVAIQNRIDDTFSGSTDTHIWGNWSDIFNSVIKTGQKREFDSVRYTINGKSRLISMVCTPLQLDQENESLGGTLAIEDITDRTEIEQQLDQAERLAAIGKVAGKVAHELNNPMDGILRYLNLTYRIVEQENLEKAKEYLQHCRQGLLRMVQIVSELLDFSRSTDMSFEMARIDHILTDAVKSMETRTNKINLQIFRNCSGGMPHLRSGSIYQVFSNLIKNSLDAMEGHGDLRIDIQSDEKVLCVSFQDTGPGFPPEKAETLFEPFYTTKGAGKGTGLGLAICKDIIEKYDGRITAENAPNGGSVFKVFLPLSPVNFPVIRDG